MANDGGTRPGEGETRPRLWGFGGGKGGVGKSVTALHVATQLALGGRQVVLVDGDLGSPNLHTLLGIRRPGATLSSFIQREVDRLEDALVETCVPGLRLIAGSRDVFGAANPKFLQKQRVLRHLHGLDADEVVLDLGAGTSFHTLDLFNAATHRLVVLTAEPTALQNAYGFVKMALYRRILAEMGRGRTRESAVGVAIREALEGAPENRVRHVGELVAILDRLSPEGADELRGLLAASTVCLVVNMASETEGAAVARTLAQVGREFLQIDCRYAGNVGADSAVVQAVRKMRPHLLDHRFGFRWQEVVRIRRAVEGPDGAVSARPATASRAAALG